MVGVNFMSVEKSIVSVRDDRYITFKNESILVFLT